VLLRVVFNITLASRSFINYSFWLIHYQLQVSVNNSGTLTNNGSIVLNGISAQNFLESAATINAMNNLEVNNPAGVVTIDQSFTFKRCAYINCRYY